LNEPPNNIELHGRFFRPGSLLPRDILMEGGIGMGVNGGLVELELDGKWNVSSALSAAVFLGQIGKTRKKLSRDLWVCDGPEGMSTYVKCGSSARPELAACLAQVFVRRSRI